MERERRGGKEGRIGRGAQHKRWGSRIRGTYSEHEEQTTKENGKV